MEANYQTKEERWLKKKLGVITASELKRLLSKSGKFTQTNISYLYEKQYERLCKEMLPKVDTYEMRAGKENEQYAVAWLRENYPDKVFHHCSEDYEDIVFVVAENGLGISPDVIIGDNEGIVEIKCVVSRANISTYFNPAIPYAKKKQIAFEEHKEQLAGQLTGFPNIDKIYLLKYRPQLDDNEWDMKSVVDKSRGELFAFTREELQDLIDEINRIVPIADAFISSNKDIGEINIQKKDELFEQIAEVCKPKLK